MKRLTWALVVLAGCAGTGDNTGGGGQSGAAGAGGTAGSGGTGGTTGSVSHDTTIATLSGTMTWTVTWDDAAKAAGYTDCSYTRTYSDGVEDESSPWLCPDCTTVVHVKSAMTSGQADCFAQLQTTAPSPDEWIGWSSTGLYRASAQNYLLTAQGTRTDGDTFTTTNSVDSTLTDATKNVWNFHFDIAGSFTTGTTTGDPQDGLYPPSTYACGWPKADPPAYTGDYQLAIGATLPDGIFTDTCGEPMRLHDFKGKWLVVDVSATDCGPCQAMATGEPQFLADMTAAGKDVEVITFLAPSLADDLGTSDVATLTDWRDHFALTGPVLADRGYGVWVMGMGAQTISGVSFGYPTWLVVDPDLNVQKVQIGFGDWSEAETVITAS